MLSPPVQGHHAATSPSSTITRVQGDANFQSRHVLCILCARLCEVCWMLHQYSGGHHAV